MAAMELDTAQIPLDDEYSPRKRFKVSELPLNSSQRSTIDSLLHTIKKKGEYDALRKCVWAQYLESEDKTAFTNSLNDLAEAEIERNPSLLSRERGQAATLMQGAVDRSNIYKSVESSLDSLIAQHVGVVEKVARDIRRKDIGEEAAAEEERRGNKPDEEYEAEATVKREARQKQKEKEEARKRREEEVEKLRAEEAKKKAELDKLRRADERRREHQAKEEKRAKDREAHRALLKEKEQEEQLRRDSRRQGEPKRREGRDRSIERLRPELDPEGTPRSREPTGQDSQTPVKEEKSATPPPKSPIDEKAIENAALEALIQEGKQLADKSTSYVRPGRPASIEPPSLRKSQSVKAPRPAEPSPPKGPSADRSRSPQKAIVIPTGPKLGYSQTRRPRASPPPDRVPRTPAHSDTQHRRESVDDRHRSHDVDPRYDELKRESSKYEAGEGEYATSRDHSKTRSHRDEERRPYYESRHASSRHGDYDREREKPRSSHREHDEERYRSSRDHDHEKDKYRSSRDYDYDKDKYRRSSRDYDHEKEKYRSFRDYDYDKDKDRSTRHRSRDRDRDRRYERSERSRSGERSSYHQRSTGSTGVIHLRGYRDADRQGDRPRPKSPVEIDRYVPSTSSRAKELEPRSYPRERSKYGADGTEEENKDVERERAYADKERYVEKERDRDRDRDRYAEREREKKSFVEIDRYVPGGGDKGRERERDKDRDRDREREGARERDRDRDRERYKEREGGRERERDRDSERDRERDRGKERSR